MWGDGHFHHNHVNHCDKHYHLAKRGEPESIPRVLSMPAADAKDRLAAQKTRNHRERESDCFAQNIRNWRERESG